MQQAVAQGAERDRTDSDMVRETAEHLVARVGRDAAVRMCRANMWLGVLAEIERTPER